MNDFQSGFIKGIGLGTILGMLFCFLIFEVNKYIAKKKQL